MDAITNENDIKYYILDQPNVDNLSSNKPILLSTSTTLRSAMTSLGEGGGGEGRTGRGKRQMERSDSIVNTPCTHIASPYSSLRSSQRLDAPEWTVK